MGPQPEIRSRKLDEVLAVNEFSKNQDCSLSEEFTIFCDGTQETRVRRLRTKHQEQFPFDLESYSNTYTLTRPRDDIRIRAYKYITQPRLM